MSIKTSTWRRVQHRVTTRLTEDDRFDANDNGYGQARGKPFLVDTVAWPTGYSDPDGPPTSDSKVGMSGVLYRKDGTLGQRRGTAQCKVSELPGAVGDDLIVEATAVWKP